MNFSPGFNERSISVHGLFGTAVADLNANTCTIDTRSSPDIDLDRYIRSRSIASQVRSQANQTLVAYALSKLKLRPGGNPYQNSFIRSIGAFYEAVKSGSALDPRIEATFGRNVTEYCLRAATTTSAELTPILSAIERPSPQNKPTILVLGGSGFIGRELVRRLIESGRTVRVMIRGSVASLLEQDSRHLEIVRGDIKNEDNLRAAMEGIDTVYHLAVGQAKNWADYKRNEVDTAKMIGELCLALGIKRLIYAGTIDSFYAGSKAGIISEQTPLDPNIARRNYYARAKAAAEDVLLQLYQTHQLPVVVVRPGIVIGKGGNPFHWGVGRFTENICEVWGRGDNPLPFVLVSDVAALMMRAAEVPKIEGRSFNIVDSPLLTANEYLTALQKLSGIQLKILHRPIWKFYAADLAKWIVKVAVQHPDRIRVPSFRDWESRTQKARYDNRQTRAVLGWKSNTSKQQLVDQGINESLILWRRSIT